MGLLTCHPRPLPCGCSPEHLDSHRAAMQIKDLHMETDSDELFVVSSVDPLPSPLLVTGSCLEF